MSHPPPQRAPIGDDSCHDTCAAAGAAGREAPRVSLQSIGCRLNSCEIEALAVDFQRHGYVIVAPDGSADICVINTCTVTGSGDADSRKAVRRARRMNPQASIVVTGCYAQRCAAQVYAAGADLVVGNGDKAELRQRLEQHGRHPGPSPSMPRGRPVTKRFLPIHGIVPGGRTRGSLQIQDGCDEHCTYCIIPSVRGPGVSRAPAEVIAQARRMVSAGYRELVLTGVHTGSYGRDVGDPNALVELLHALEEIPELARVRLNSLEPGFVSPQLLAFAARSRTLCRHFHIPLQSGDDDVLRRMGRRYGRDQYAELIRHIAVTIPDCAIGADVLVGFPGETDAQFQRTRELLEDLPLTYLHVFPYSRREGTAAARLNGHLPRHCKRQRTQALIALARGKRMAFHQRCLGACIQVLIEDRRDEHTGQAMGLTDNYVKALFPATAAPNQLVRVRVRSADVEGVRGIMEE